MVIGSYGVVGPYLMGFHSLEVVDRVSETQLQVSENSVYRER